MGFKVNQKLTNGRHYLDSRGRKDLKLQLVLRSREQYGGMKYNIAELNTVHIPAEIANRRCQSTLVGTGFVEGLCCSIHIGPRNTTSLDSSTKR